MNRSTLIAVSTWMLYLCLCQARVQVIVINIILDVDAWIEKTRRNDESSPSTTVALCCPRAMVTMRAYCHKDQGVDSFRQWDNLKRGRLVQQHQAQELHREAEVAYGPCGLEELRQFQQALGPQYQLLVMTRMKPFFLSSKDLLHPIGFVYSNPVIILMAVRRFLVWPI